MSTRTLLFTTLLAATVAGAGPATAQHEGHQAPGAANPAAAAAQVAQCRQAQPAVTAMLDAAVKRLEDARQTNSAAVMRATTEELQAVLVQVRAELAPCGAMQSPASADPHAGHAMPGAAPPAPAPAAPSAPAHAH